MSTQAQKGTSPATKLVGFVPLERSTLLVEVLKQINIALSMTGALPSPSSLTSRPSLIRCRPQDSSTLFPISATTSTIKVGASLKQLRSPPEMPLTEIVPTIVDSPAFTERSVPFIAWDDSRKTALVVVGRVVVAAFLC
jgi:hypothetical protein